MDLSWALTRIRESHPEAAAKLTRALAILDDGVGVKRRIVDDLRPALLDNLGLGAAITWHVEQMSERGGLKCDVRVPEDDSPLPGHIAIALFRVVQESLTNVVRHAKAARTWIELQRDGAEVKLEIRDDGIGLPRPAARGPRAHGIVSMRQRILGVGGEFEIARTHPQGTRVYVRVPLAATMPVDQRADQSQGVD